MNIIKTAVKTNTLHYKAALFCSSTVSQQPCTEQADFVAGINDDVNLFLNEHVALFILAATHEVMFNIKSYICVFQTTFWAQFLLNFDSTPPKLYRRFPR